MAALVVGVLLCLSTRSHAALTIQWTDTYNGASNYTDRGHGVAADTSGNVYVVGTIFAGIQDYNIWVRKYNSAGTVQWTTDYNTPNNSTDGGGGIAVDGSGNVYVTGYEMPGGQAENIWVRKYDANGLVLWTTTYNSPGNSSDKGQGIAVDGSGNVYVTGYETRIDLGQGANIWVRKYDTNGLVLWTTTYNNPINGDDYGKGVAVDGSGNVYVTGEEDRGMGQGFNVWVRKYDTNGLVIWTTTYNSPGNSADEGQGIAVDGSGGVYVTGDEYRGDLGQNYNIWVRKYDTNGLPLWTATYNSPNNGADVGNGITVDGNSNVYVTGYEDRGDLGQSRNVWVRKYDTNGLVLWTTTYNSPGNSLDEGQGIAVNRDGNVLVAGYENRGDLGQQDNIWIRRWSQPAPAAPSGLSVKDAGTGTALHLTWLANNENDLKDYRVYRGSASGTLTSKTVVATASASGTIFQDGNLVRGTRYFYQLTARDTSGNESARSEEVSGVPTDPSQAEIPVTIEVPGVGTVSVMVFRNDVRVVLEKRADVPDGMVSSEANQAVVTAVGNIQPGNFTFRVFTPAGETVYEKTEEKGTPSSWSWVPRGLASGTYFIQVEGPGVKSAKKVVVGR